MLRKCSVADRTQPLSSFTGLLRAASRSPPLLPRHLPPARRPTSSASAYKIRVAGLRDAPWTVAAFQRNTGCRLPATDPRSARGPMGVCGCSLIRTSSATTKHMITRMGGDAGHGGHSFPPRRHLLSLSRCQGCARSTSCESAIGLKPIPGLYGSPERCISTPRTMLSAIGAAICLGSAPRRHAPLTVWIGGHL
jgi:hypothetical protein